MYPDCRARSVVRRVCGGRDHGEAPEVHGRTMSKAAAAALSMVLIASAFSAIEANAAEGGTSQLVSVAANGSATLTAASTTPAVSGDGRYVAFDWAARKWSPATRTARATSSSAIVSRARTSASRRTTKATKPPAQHRAGHQSQRPLRRVRVLGSIDDGVGEVANEGVATRRRRRRRPGQGHETRDKNGTPLDVYVLDRDADRNGVLDEATLTGQPRRRRSAASPPISSASTRTSPRARSPTSRRRSTPSSRSRPTGDSLPSRPRPQWTTADTNDKVDVYVRDRDTDNDDIYDEPSTLDDDLGQRRPEQRARRRSRAVDQ